MPEVLTERLVEQERPDLVADLERIYTAVMDIWSVQRDQTFTAHGKEHIDQVARNLTSLIEPLRGTDQDLNAMELYVLLAACYVHDIGMQLDFPDARKDHAQYAYDLVLGNLETRGRSVSVEINDMASREAIAEIARAHWTSFALELSKEDFLGENSMGRLRLLGVLLALADLLDLSPVRARYFRTAHRLYGLGALSELHQAAHHFLRGFEISFDPDTRELQYQLSWRTTGEYMETLSDWVLHWFTSQWRTLAPLAIRDSGGHLRWKDPWATAEFREPRGQHATLSSEATGLLRAVRTEQLRINRDAFVKQFSSGMGKGDWRLFLISGGHEEQMIQWTLTCPYQLESPSYVARIDLRDSSAHTVDEALTEWSAQWLEDGRSVTRAAMSAKLAAFLREREGYFLLVVILEEWARPLGHILRIFFNELGVYENRGRDCVVFAEKCPEEDVAGLPNRVETCKYVWGDIPQESVRSHLSESWGMQEPESVRLSEEVFAMSLLSRRRIPALYYFVSRRGRVWENVE